MLKKIDLFNSFRTTNNNRTFGNLKSTVDTIVIDET